MASIIREILIDANPADVWEALCDFGAVHERLVPGFVVAARMDGGDRLVTFASGVEVRERLVDRDDGARRLVWTILDGPYAHHNGAAQVFADGQERTRFVWVTDLLPDDMAGRTEELMEQASAVMERTLGR
jgi:hypothetical protein